MNNWLADAEDRERWRAQVSTDPRAAERKHRARMALYEDSSLTLAELGTQQDEFIEPEGK